MLSKLAIKYYFQSIPTLINNFNWWVFPLVFFTKPVFIKIKNNPSFYVSNLMDIWTLKEVIIDRQYEKGKIVNNGDFIIDVGAAIGDFSISIAKKVKKVIAYEYDDERVCLMKKNLQINGVTNVVLKHVKAKSLKQLLKGVDKIQFLKIDCEGGEYDIFRNADKADLAKIQYIAMEAHKFNKKMKNEYLDLLNMLKRNNFDVKMIPNSVRNDICFVFAHKNYEWNN